MWNNVSNKNATTVEKLAQGYSRAASVAKTWGMDMHELNAVIGTVTAATKQSGNEVGNFLKNVLPRLTSAPAQDALGMIGVSLTDETGNLKTALQIYREISVEYKRLSDLDKSIVAEGLAGKYHISRMSAFLSNMELVDKMYNDSVNSANSASNENAIYMESLQARINQTKASFEQLALAVGDAFLTESFIQFLQGMGTLAEMAAGVSSGFGVLPVVFGGVATAALLMNKTFQASVRDMTVAQATARSFGVTMSGLAVTLKGLVASTGVGAIFVAIGFGIEKLLGSVAKAREASESLAAEQKQISLEFTDNKDAILDLTKQYEEYSKIINSGNYELEDLQKFNEIRNELGGLMPTLVQGEDSYGNKILGTSANLTTQISILERQAELQERIAANKEKEEINTNYDTALSDLEDAKDKMDNLFGGTFTVGGLQISDSKELDEAIQKYEKLEEKASETGKSLSIAQQNRYDSLKDLRDTIQQETMDFESAQMSFQSSAMAKIQNSMSLDKEASSPMKDLVNDFTLYVSTIETDADKVDDTFNTLLSNIGNKDYKKMFSGLEGAVQEYQNAISEGLTGEELEPFEDAVREMNEKVKASFSNMMKDAKIDPSVIKEVMNNFDASVYSALNFDQALDTLSKTTGKTKEELIAQLQLAPQVADGYTDIGDSANDAASGTEEILTLTGQLVEKYNELTDEISPLNEALERMAEGKSLTATEAMNLIEQEEALAGAISVENGVIKVNQKAVEELRDTKIASYADMEKSVLAEATQVANASLSKLENYGLEVQAIKTLAEAKQSLAELDNLAALTSGMGTENTAAKNLDAARSQVSGLVSAYETIENLSKMVGTSLKQVGTAQETYDSKTKKAKKTEKEKNEEFKNSIYVSDEYSKALESVTTQLEKINQLKEKYPSHSQKYRNAIQQEIKLLQEQKALIESQASSLSNQISSGRIKQTGIVTSTSPLKGYSGKYADEINAASSKFGVDPYLIASIIKQESNFNAKATSSAGARGLMQLMPGTARGLGVNNSFDPTQNIMGGTKYIAQMLAKFGGDIKKALIAYNAGAGNVAKVLNSAEGKWKEPKNYIEKVLGNFKNFTGSGYSNGNKASAPTSPGSSSIADYYLDNFRITSRFQQQESFRKNPHGGLDFANGRQGDPIKSLGNGKVLQAYYSSTGGYMVVVQQDDGKVAKYMHMQKGLNVKAGDNVTTGQQLGKLGNTGRSTGAHLHLQIESNGKKIDPETYLKGLQSQTSSIVATGDMTVAEQLQSIDQAKSELLGLQSDASNIEAQIEQLKNDLIMSFVDEFEYRIQQQQNLIDQLGNSTYGMSTTSDQYREVLEEQKEAYQAMADINEAERLKIFELKKTQGITEATKAQLDQTLVEVMQRRYEIASQREALTMSVIESSMGAFDEKIDDLDYLVAYQSSLRESMVENSSDYLNSLQREQEILEKKKKLLTEQNDALIEQTYLNKLNVEDMKVLEEQLEDQRIAMLEIDNTLSSIQDSYTQITTNRMNERMNEEVDSLSESYEKLNKELEGLVEVVDKFDVESLNDSLEALYYQLDKIRGIESDSSFLSTKSAGKLNRELKGIATDIKSIAKEVNNMTDSTSNDEDRLESLIRKQAEYANGLYQQIQQMEDDIRDRQLDQQKIEDGIQNKIDLKQEEINQLEEQYEAEDRLKRIQEMNDAIAEKKADKRFSYIDEDGNETLTYDRAAVAELEKERDEQLAQYQREDIKQAMADELARLQQHLTETQELHQVELEMMELQKNSLSSLYDQLNTDISTKLSLLQELQNQNIENTRTQWEEMIKAVEEGTLAFDEKLGTWYEKTVEDMSAFNTSLDEQVDKIVASFKKLSSAEVKSPSKGSSGGGGGGSSSSSPPAGGGWTSSSGSGSYDHKTGDYTIKDKDGNVTKGNGSKDDYDKELQKLHDGGIVNGKTSRLTEIANKFFNVDPNNERLIKMLPGELSIPPKNIPNIFTTMGNLVNSILPKQQASIVAPTENHFHFSGLTIKANNMDEMLSSLDHYVRNK